MLGWEIGAGEDGEGRRGGTDWLTRPAEPVRIGQGAPAIGGGEVGGGGRGDAGSGAEAVAFVSMWMRTMAGGAVCLRGRGVGIARLLWYGITFVLGDLELLEALGEAGLARGVVERHGEGKK